jgi:hypothetical protein
MLLEVRCVPAFYCASVHFTVLQLTLAGFLHWSLPNEHPNMGKKTKMLLIEVGVVIF